MARKKEASDRTVVRKLTVHDLIWLVVSESRIKVAGPGNAVISEATKPHFPKRLQ
jgi:hypothetical protein